MIQTSAGGRNASCELTFSVRVNVVVFPCLDELIASIIDILNVFLPLQLWLHVGRLDMVPEDSQSGTLWALIAFVGLILHSLWTAVQFVIYWIYAAALSFLSFSTITLPRTVFTVLHWSGQSSDRSVSFR